MTDPYRPEDEGEPVQLTCLERGLGTVIGFGRVEPLPDISPPARGVLETIVLEALQKPPCVVSFSGGRDSSAILAVAAVVARREGLAPPVPVSLRFPECASATEDEWQTMVVRRLALPDWQRLDFRDELDIVGPVATEILRTKGALWPFNAYFHVPIMSVARGGSVLSGVFGDEIFSAGWAWHRENQVLQRRSPLLGADPVRVVVALGPPSLRGRFLRERARRAHAERRPVRPAWIQPDAFEAVLAARNASAARESLSFRRSVKAALWPLRSRVVGNRSMTALSRDHDTTYSAPFADPRFISALVRERGWRMFRDRTEAIRWLAGDVLPEQLSGRTTKAWFDTAFFNRHARAFAATWTGHGVDPAYVDPAELRRTWLEDDEPDARTYQLLQRAWLADEELRTRLTRPTST